MNQPQASWVPGADASEFSLANLPYGVFSTRGSEPRIGVAIGEQLLDMKAAAEGGLFDAAFADRFALTATTLNIFMAAGAQVQRAVRARVAELLSAPALRSDVEPLLVQRRDATMHLPFLVGDYVDFYSSLEHATNMGRILRPGGEPLLPNWRHIPIGYHGRAGTVVIDGTPIRRPNGQTKAADAQAPSFGPTRSLDIELEMGFVTGTPSKFGQPVPVGSAPEHIFGLLLVNDWSARDIQAWEYQPLGPFLGKSFATSISPWVVTLDALEPFRVAGPKQEPPPLPYLRMSEDFAFDVRLRVLLQTQSMRERGMDPATISTSNLKYLYWNMAQQLAHAASNGATVRTGDLFATGTISGPTPESRGSFMELSWRGAHPIELPSGEHRSFLEDGDEVTIQGWCEAPGKPRIGFGEVRGRIEPA